MYYDRFFPFYTAYSNPLLYEGELAEENEFNLMKSYYPAMSQRIQEKVEEVCDRLDYEGSSIYDEYPDRFLLHHLCKEIQHFVEPEMEAQRMPEGFLDELVQVLLYQEISRRRCRRHRCRRFY